MNRLQKRTFVLSNINVLDACLELKMNLNGSSDTLSEDKKYQYASFLETVIETWEEDSNTGFNSMFDNSVKNLVLVTLNFFQACYT